MPDKTIIESMPFCYHVVLDIKSHPERPEFCCKGLLTWYENGYEDPFEVAAHMCGEDLGELCELTIVDLMTQYLAPPLFP